MTHELIDAATTRKLCGGISDMALWRWLKRPELNFPLPRYVGTRRYWVKDEVLQWQQRLPRKASVGGEAEH